MAVTKKMLQKFPFHDDALKNMAFLNPEFKEQLVADCGKYFLKIKYYIF